LSRDKKCDFRINTVLPVWILNKNSFSIISHPDNMLLSAFIHKSLLLSLVVVFLILMIISALPFSTTKQEHFNFLNDDFLLSITFMIQRVIFYAEVFPINKGL